MGPNGLNRPTRDERYNREKLCRGSAFYEASESFVPCVCAGRMQQQSVNVGHAGPTCGIDCAECGHGAAYARSSTSVGGSVSRLLVSFGRHVANRHFVGGTCE